MACSSLRLKNEGQEIAKGVREFHKMTDVSGHWQEGRLGRGVCQSVYPMQASSDVLLYEHRRRQQALSTHKFKRQSHSQAPSLLHNSE